MKLFKKKQKPEVPKHNKKMEEAVIMYKKGQYIKPKEMFKMYNIGKMKNMTDFKGFKHKLLNKYFPLNTLMINMQLTNGQFMQFIVKIKNGGFIFDNGFYIIDDEKKYYNATSNKWCLDYHEELCFPIDKKVNINEIKNAILESNEVELETAINPVSLQKFMESTVIQKLLAGAEMEDSLRLIKTIVIVNVIVTIISLLLLANMSGLLG